MPSRFAFAILVAALSVSSAPAQIRAAGGTAGFGISVGSGTGAGRMGGASGHFHQGYASQRRSTFLAYPFFDSDSDYNSAENYAQPQVIVVQAAPVAPPAPPAPRESLLIEWQGDRFVRSTASEKISSSAQIAPDYAEKSASPSLTTGRSVPGQKIVAQPPRELPPAVLVFHDGRKEEVSEYTIMSGTIYSKADYWTTGSWTRKIQIADLDVPATLKLNQKRGLKFVLPASSNEVITRP